jgi:hypothetical protein
VPAYLEPWPQADCPGCNKPMTLSRFDGVKRRTIVRHADESPPCELEGGSPYHREGASISFPIATEAEFDDPVRAGEWAGAIARRDGTSVYYGYVRGHDGHRKIGRVPHEDLAIAVAEHQQDGTTLLRKARRQ